MNTARAAAQKQAMACTVLPYAILDTIDDPVQVLDTDYRIVWCNSFISDGKRFGPQDLVGHVCFEKFFGRDKPCPDCPVERVFSGGVNNVADKLLALPSGAYTWRRVHAYPIRDEHGRTVMAVKIGFDITPAKRQESRLEKYLGQLETQVQDGSSQGQAIRDMGLTAREKEVLRLLAGGFTNAGIAKLLGISPNTVKTHVGHIFDKLGVGDRAQAAAWAVRLELA